MPEKFVSIKKHLIFATVFHVLDLRLTLSGLSGAPFFGKTFLINLRQQ